VSLFIGGRIYVDFDDAKPLVLSMLGDPIGGDQ
jgi:hypothetical protein